MFDAVVAVQSYAVGTPAHVDEAVTAAEAAFYSYAGTSRADRARFLDRIADEIDARSEEITRMGCQETGLPEGRLVGERGRTVGQLRMFARHINPVPIWIKDTMLRWSTGSQCRAQICV